MTRKGYSGLAILVAAAVLMGSAAAAPYYWKTMVDADIAASGDMLALLERKMGAAGQGKRPAAFDANAVYVNGSTAGLAGAELQRIVAELAQASGMTLDKLEVLPPEDRDGATVVRLDVETAGTIEALRAYLHAIETGAPLIFVKEAHIGVDKQDNDTAATLPSERLTVALQLEALAWLDK